MFEHQFKHEAVGLELKLFWWPLAQQIRVMSSTSLCNLSDQEPRWCQFCDWVLKTQITLHSFYCEINQAIHLYYLQMTTLLPGLWHINNERRNEDTLSTNHAISLAVYLYVYQLFVKLERGNRSKAPTTEMKREKKFTGPNCLEVLTKKLIKHSQTDEWVNNVI